MYVRVPCLCLCLRSSQEGLSDPLELSRCVGAGNRTPVLCKGSKLSHLSTQFSNLSELHSCGSVENAWASFNLVWGGAWVSGF